MRVTIHDHQQIAAFLSQDPGRYLYETGDLDPFFWPHTLWFGWQVQSKLEALCLIYLGDQTPILLAMGDSVAQRDLLQSLQDLLPQRFYAHLAQGLEICFEGWQKSGGERYHRMLLEPNRFQQVPLSSDKLHLKTLAAADLEALLNFYSAAYPDNWFNPRMLETGQYLGLFQEDRLQAVAGIHVFSLAYQVAALGNIAVGSKLRGQSLGAGVTSALCEQMMTQVKHIGLNVASDNPSAIRCYQKIGFEIYLDYHEWRFTRPWFHQSASG